MIKLLRNFLSKSECDDIYNDFITSKDKWEYDNVVRGSQILRLSPKGIDYTLKYQNILEDIVGEKLNLVSVSVREMYKGQQLRKHTDPQEFVFSLPIKQSDNKSNLLSVWENGTKKKIDLGIGDVLIMEASKVLHAREEVKSDWITIALLSFRRLNEGVNKIL